MDTQAFKFSLSILAAGAGVACLVATSPQNAAADSSLTRGEAERPAFAPGMINHMQKMRRFKDKDHGPQSTPAVVPRSSTDQNASGEISTFQPGGATITANNTFFQDLGAAGTATWKTIGLITECYPRPHPGEQRHTQHHHDYG